MQKLLFGLLLFASIGISLAQTRSITGTVIGKEDGAPIPGVSVSIKGTSIGAITSIDGLYSLSIPESAETLVFSFIGLVTQEVAINNRTVINVQLESETFSMDEVMVVAYGTAKKESITGAVAMVNAKSIESRPLTNASGVLEGLASGVQVNNSYGEPGSEPKVRIRGFTTVSSVAGANDPLYVIDGVPYGGNISDLNPQDIESMSVLKDAASAALYGNRASNGVILITTKKGRSGENPSIRLNINQGVYNRGIKEYERVSADEFMETSWKGYRNYLMTSQSLSESDASTEASNSLVSSILKYNLYNKADDALFDANGKLVADAKINPGYDDLNWNDYIERLGYRQDYNISANGASEKSNYYLSAGYLNEKGYVISSDYERLTARTNVSISPKKWIKTGLSTSASHQISNNTTGSADDATTFVNPFYYARNMAPIYPVYVHDAATGEYLLDSDGNKQYDRGDAFSRPQNLDRHIVWELDLNKDEKTRNTLQSIAFVDIKLLTDFTFTVKGDINLRNNTRKVYNNATIGDGAGNKGRASRTVENYKNYTFQQQLSWDKNYGPHHIDVLAGHENYSNNYEYLYGYKTTETFEGGVELVNFTNITSLDGYQDNYKTESYLSRARYNFDNKYFLDGSFRRDGSSRFYADSRWGNFWSVGGSWSIMKEGFMAPASDYINTLKLRTSYGEVGNDQGVEYYAYMALFNMDQNANQGAVYKKQNEAKNLQWETSSSFGVALEGRLLNRLNFSAEYFDKRSKDLLFDVNMPLSAGATSTTKAESVITQNIGTISNTGIEASLDFDIIPKTRDWRWNMGLNATLMKNEIVKLPDANKENGIISGTKKYMEGHSVYDFWLFQFAGVDQMSGQSLYLIDESKFYVGTDAVTGKTAVPVANQVQIGDKYYANSTTYAKKDFSGRAIPDVYGSISSLVTFKNWDLNILCTYSVGGKTLDYSYQSLMSATTAPHALHKDILNSWNGIPEGMTADSPNRLDPNGIPVANYGLNSNNNAISSRFLQDASYFIVKNININYNIPAHILKKIDINGASINASVENLATITSLQGMNPQQNFNGINDNAFVPARVFSVGVNIKL